MKTTIDAMNIITSVDNLKPYKMDAEDKITVITAYIELAKKLEPVYKKYCNDKLEDGEYDLVDWILGM